MVALVMMAPEALDKVEALLPEKYPRQVFNAIQRGVIAQANRFVAEFRPTTPACAGVTRLAGVTAR